MPQQVIIQSDGQLKVIEVGPQGPPGRPGDRGLQGPRGPGARHGLEVVTDTTETIDEVEYRVYTLGGTSAEYYVILYEPGLPILLRVSATASAAGSSAFRVGISLALSATENYNEKFYIEIPDLPAIQEVPLWETLDNGVLNFVFTCVPGYQFGLPGYDVWYPISQPLSPPRQGAWFVDATPFVEDEVTDCKIHLTGRATNTSSLCSDVDGYTYPVLDLGMETGMNATAKPLRVELLNADLVTAIRVYGILGEAAADFDPVALGLINGTTITFMVRFVNRGAGPVIVLDPIF